MKPTVVLADDHAILTEGLKTLLEGSFHVVAVVHNGRDALQAVRTHHPAVIVLDISMPLLNGIDTVRELRRFDPKIKVVILTMHTDLDFVREAFERGASAYVLKDSASLDLRRAIQRALQGRTYMTPGIAENGLDGLMGRVRGERTISEKLTSRQREVLQLLAEGRTAKEAAAILNLSSRTVEFHKYRLMKQLGVQTVAQLTQFAIRQKIIAIT
jgi:DNA-binding NarL/FixJ family response regulator